MKQYVTRLRLFQKGAEATQAALAEARALVEARAGSGGGSGGASGPEAAAAAGEQRAMHAEAAGKQPHAAASQ